MTCPECGGCGWVVEIVPDRAPGCTGERCVSGCPIPVQRQDQCGACCGSGEITDEPSEGGEGRAEG
jgi:hypothetical protein